MKGRYVGALVVVAVLLVAGQYIVQLALDRQEGDARVVNTAGRQRMLSQRYCMWLYAGDRARVAEVVAEWTQAHDALQREGSPEVVQRFAALDGDYRAMLGARDAADAMRHQDAYLTGMDAIVATIEREARDRVLALRRTELAILGCVLLVLALEGLFVLRPAVRAAAERDAAQAALLEVADRTEKALAQELHDGLSQHLVGVAFLVKTLPNTDEISRLLAESIEMTRGLSRRLYSHTLEVDGLVPALRDLAAQTERVFGVICHVEGELELPMPAREHVYRIVREAVMNAAKHAKASSIDVQLARDAIRVTDDGRGIPANAPPGMGLRLMASRAKMIGAMVEVTGSPSGTVVTCRLSA